MTPIRNAAAAPGVGLPREAASQLCLTRPGSGPCSVLSPKGRGFALSSPLGTLPSRPAFALCVGRICACHPMQVPALCSTSPQKGRDSSACLPSGHVERADASGVRLCAWLAANLITVRGRVWIPSWP